MWNVTSEDGRAKAVHSNEKDQLDSFFFHFFFLSLFFL